jgi:hypothetical protein
MHGDETLLRRLIFLALVAIGLASLFRKVLAGLLHSYSILATSCFGLCCS